MGDPRTLRILFWNAWLLHPRVWPSGPRLPVFRSHFAPEVDRRARAAGRAVAGRFDVAAFGECWDDLDAGVVADAWRRREDVTVVPGPTPAGKRLTGSGLLTVVDGLAVTRTATMTYEADGQPWRDADALARKGALLVEVDPGPGLPRVEVCSTHLFAGGGWLPAPGHDDQARHHEVRMRQVDELVRFVQAHHRREHVLVLTGDLNVAAVDHTDPADPTARYGELLARLAPLGVVDAWSERGAGRGGTANFFPPTDLPLDPAEPDAVLDDPDEAGRFPESVRIDHALVALPGATGGSGRAELGRVERWAFARAIRDGAAVPLSDHLGVSVELILEAG
ncbi:MAG: hypothetical protein JWM05_3541 [Acidimicrobiales bacterium]|nr:hypothetical protein [Acidimicrobiales bacterium]